MATNDAGMRVNIITPDGTIFSEDGVDLVVARALDGEFGIMRDHAPLVAALKVWPIRIKKDGKETVIAVFGGFMEVKDNVVTITSRVAETADYIDIERAIKARDRALSRLESKDKNIDYERAEFALQRALIRLQVAGATKLKS